MVKTVVIVCLLGWSALAQGLGKEEKAAIKAIITGDIESLKSYLEAHPDVNCLFSNGKTGLYYAIVHNEREISEFLLHRGADPDFIVHGHSTLKWAIDYHRPRIVRLLIEYGAEVNKTDDKHNTPLIYAAVVDNLEICKILIDRGANPIHTNLKGRRASQYAFQFSGSPTYTYLLAMEDQFKNQDSIPSMHDGPYISWESDERIVMTYYEREQEQNLTRLIEKTLPAGESDTLIQGIGRDKNWYHIHQEYEADPTETFTRGNIFVMGDIHGRYHALVNMLKNNHVIDTAQNWSFGEGHLILLGDAFDRGANVTEALWFLHELGIQARNAGGDVHLLLGNHEVMALTGDHRYVNDKYKFFAQFTQTHYYEWFEKNTMLGSWLRSQNVILRLNDYLFLHAGISPQFATFDYRYEDINRIVREFLHSDYRPVKGSPADHILGPFGPQWYRGYINLSEKFPEMTQEFVDVYLDSKGLKRMIVGHNELTSIRSDFGGKVISVDVAIDESGRSAQGLLISGDNIFRCYADGTKEEME